MKERKDNRPHGPEAIAQLLRTESPVLLVGGQAVNLWALHYHDRTADLAPFVSRDVDLLGNRETLAEIARLAMAQPQYFSLRPPSNEVGVVIARDVDDHPVLIEVLRYVHGVSEKDLSEPSYTFETGGCRLRVPGPVALLKAKLANVADIDQSGRQDLRHVRILCRLLPDYWRDICNAARTQEITERRLIDLLEEALKTVRSRSAKAVLKSIGISVHDIFVGLDPEDLPKVSAFIRKRLSRLG